MIFARKETSSIPKIILENFIKETNNLTSQCKDSQCNLNLKFLKK